MHAANRLFSRWHTSFAYNFLMNCAILTIFDMLVGIDNKNKIPFTLLENIKKCMRHIEWHPAEINLRCARTSRVCMLSQRSYILSIRLVIVI